jgi:transposase
MLYVGIDVHKNLCYACIKDKAGNILGELSFPNNSQGVNRLLDTIGGRKAKAVLESTGNLWIRPHHQLEEAGVEVLLSNPNKTKAIAGARIKNDRRNARTLADLLRTNAVKTCYVPPKEQWH